MSFRFNSVTEQQTVHQTIIRYQLTSIQYYSTRIIPSSVSGEYDKVMKIADLGLRGWADVLREETVSDLFAWELMSVKSTFPASSEPAC